MTEQPPVDQPLAATLREVLKAVVSLGAGRFGHLRPAGYRQRFPL